jgi:hypothetical protein
VEKEGGLGGEEGAAVESPLRADLGKHSIWEKAFCSDVLAVIKRCGDII